MDAPSVGTGQAISKGEVEGVPRETHSNSPEGPSLPQRKLAGKEAGPALSALWALPSSSAFLWLLLFLVVETCQLFKEVSVFPHPSHFPGEKGLGCEWPGLRQGLTGGRGGRRGRLLARCFRGLYLASWYSSNWANLSVIAARRQAGRGTSLSSSSSVRRCQRDEKPSGARPSRTKWEHFLGLSDSTG